MVEARLYIKLCCEHVESGVEVLPGIATVNAPQALSRIHTLSHSLVVYRDRIMPLSSIIAQLDAGGVVNAISCNAEQTRVAVAGRDGKRKRARSCR